MLGIESAAVRPQGPGPALLVFDVAMRDGRKLVVGVGRSDPVGEGGLSEIGGEILRRVAAATTRRHAVALALCSVRTDLRGRARAVFASLPDNGGAVFACETDAVNVAVVRLLASANAGLRRVAAGKSE